ncbi:MAG: GNAT family N-acetyltransferase [Boseongicola sp.]|nr:GNAT family N-acetyltransferase [Boseongicola sp.]NNL17696.1 GNAT family N-acetyltransferase [Boseongicola sp.]
MPEFSEAPASVREYCDLRDASGLGAFPEENARIGLSNTLTGVWLREEGPLIAMARIIGDGGCFAQVTDVAVHPDFQRQGLGAKVMAEILKQAHERLPKNLYLSLIADPGAENLYVKFDFEPRHGMSVILQ